MQVHRSWRWFGMVPAAAASATAAAAAAAVAAQIAVAAEAGVVAARTIAAPTRSHASAGRLWSSLPSECAELSLMFTLINSPRLQLQHRSTHLLQLTHRGCLLINNGLGGLRY